MAIAAVLVMATSKRVHFVLLLSGALFLPYFVGCGGETPGGTGTGGMAGSGGSGGTGPNTTGGGGNAGSGTTAGPSTTAESTGTSASTTGGPSSENLFGCSLELSCAPLCSHLGSWGDCGGDAACVESLWGSGESGVFLFQGRPGPGNYQSDTLVVLLSDGRTLRQTRDRLCPDGEAICDLESIPWSFGDQQRCDESASISTSAENCVSANYSCDEVEDMLTGGAGGSAGAGGEAGHAGEAAE